MKVFLRTRLIRNTLISAAASVKTLPLLASEAPVSNNGNDNCRPAGKTGRYGAATKLTNRGQVYHHISI